MTVVLHAEAAGRVESVPAARAGELLGVEPGELRRAVELGEVRLLPGGRVAEAEVARLRAGPPLRERVADAGAVAAAGLLGVGAHRFGRLARAGCVRPVRWYASRYRAVVWRYLVVELLAFAAACGGAPVPAPGAGAGEDRRARGWRERRVEQLLRDAPGPWERAAVWAALLGGRAADLAGPEESARLTASAPRLWTGGRGWRLPPGEERRLCTAQDEAEITAARTALSTALAQARAQARPTAHR